MSERVSAPRAPGRGRFALGAVSLGVALASAAWLSARHLGARALPGCALDSPCGRALSGPFGTLPVVEWPLAFAGSAFFAGLLAAWWTSSRTSPAAWPVSLRWLARAGALASLALLGIAVQQDTLCPYCVAAQLANLAFVACAEGLPSARRARRPELAFLGVVLALSAALALARRLSGLAAERAEERSLAASTQAIEAGVGARAFTGRFRRGPERAALRLVLFTDYQCEDCARVEGEAWALVDERADLSLSVKHFPLCADCNRRARELGQSPHANACWAARAAEAAGIVGGPDGFWRMHRWLFERGGAFGDADLRDGLASLGLELGAFLEALHGGETLARVQSDVEEALALGIHSTPMVFLNGVELRGWRAPAALRRAVEELAARAPPARGPESDRPPDALEKALADWRAEPRVTLPARPGEDAAEEEIEVVVFSDYLEPSTRELDARIRAFLAREPRLRYSFRHYPLDPECVASVPAAHAGACRLARAAEAARAAGGEQGFERFHAWLMTARAPLAELEQGAREAGLDPATFTAALADPASLAAVRADAEAARRLGIRAIPLVLVGGRRVPRWRVAGADLLLERILAEALEAR